MKPLLLDPGEEEIMLPIPSAAQDLLWDEIYTLVKEEDLNREVKWLETPWEIRKYLASIQTAKKIDAIGVKFNLGYGQISSLAKNIKYVFIQEVPLKDFVSMIIKDLKIENKIADQISQEIKTQIFVPMREYLLKVYPVSNETRKQENNKAVKQEDSQNPILGGRTPVVIPGLTRNPAIKLGLDSHRSLPSTTIGGGNDKIGDRDDKIGERDLRPSLNPLSQSRSILGSIAINQGNELKNLKPTTYNLQPSPMRSDLKLPVFKKSKLMVPLAVEKKVVTEEIKPEKFKAVSDAHVQGIALDHFYEKIKQSNEVIKQGSNETRKQESSEVIKQGSNKAIAEQLSKMPIRTMQEDVKKAIKQGSNKTRKQ
ncbi:MAG: hypothetical protein HY219_00100 [Candidatus Staskawiczbacteria bacterium]|nr:hypothetical protein [Candidatus Staskawiczbacteria bacterium]